LSVWLNYHHLLYFWTVAKEGSVTKASKKLRLAHPTISGQIHRLEDTLGAKLFDRRGRNLALTEVGRVAFRYADEIFSLGQEFLDTMQGHAIGPQLRLVVGISDTIAKSIVHRILEPAFRLDDDIRVVCKEDQSIDECLSQLAAHALDVVLADAPAGPGTSVRAFSHLLGECGSAFFAAPKLARACRGRFPQSLDGVPLLLPTPDSTLGRLLNSWFDARGIRPKIVAELDDAALAKDFGATGMGVFVVPDVLERETRLRYGVRLLGRAKDLRQRFYAISVERKIRHPAVIAICEGARRDIFA